MTRDYFFFILVSFGLVFLYGSGCADSPTTPTQVKQTVTQTPEQIPTDEPTAEEKTSALPKDTGLDDEENNFLSLINEYRSKAGLSPLVASVTLNNASDWMSADMANNNYFSHTDSQDRDPFSRMADFGYSASAMAENIAAGHASASDTFAQWKSSSGHNANMLGSSYRAIGIGRYYQAESAYGWYWTTDFGNTIDPEKLL